MHSYKCVFNLLILSLYFVLLSKSFKSKIRLFRMYNKLVSTYESASIRRFHFGRVDNIRANTPEALEWARAMVDETGNISAAEKLRLFRQAMQAQTDLMVQVNISKLNKFQFEDSLNAKKSLWKILISLSVS
jgi:hypothetical protein